MCTPIRLLLLLWLGLSAALAIALVFAGGVWSTGRYLPFLGALGGLLVGAPQRRLLLEAGVPELPRWRLGAVLAWSAFGLVGGLGAWLLQSLSVPGETPFRFVAWASPPVILAAFGAAWVQTRFAPPALRSEIFLGVAASLILPALTVLSATRLSQPWWPIAIAAVLHLLALELCARSLSPEGRRGRSAAQGISPIV